MRNNLKKFLFLFFVLSVSFNFTVKANEINFEAKNIETVDENLISASEDVFIYDNNGNKIYSDKLFINNKKKNFYYKRKCYSEE